MRIRMPSSAQRRTTTGADAKHGPGGPRSGRLCMWSGPEKVQAETSYR
jgi:hypothetical protein